MSRAMDKWIEAEQDRAEADFEKLTADEQARIEAQSYADGWYKVSHGNTIYIREFVGGLSSAGTEIVKYIQLGYTLEPMVVMTPEQHSALLSMESYIDLMHRAMDRLNVRDEVDQEMVNIEDEEEPLI